jgi:hypothetical protein
MEWIDMSKHFKNHCVIKQIVFEYGLPYELVHTIYHKWYESDPNMLFQCLDEEVKKLKERTID